MRNGYGARYLGAMGVVFALAFLRWHEARREARAILIGNLEREQRAAVRHAQSKPQPVLEGYTALQPQISLDEVNPNNAPGAQESERWDFSGPDRAPEQELNRVIWKSVKGVDSEPPAPVQNVQWAVHRLAK